MTEQVKCRKCLALKLSSEFSDSKLSHGDYVCFVCNNEQLRQYRFANKDKIKQTNKSYYQKNRDKLLFDKKLQRPEKADLLNKKTAEWKSKNKPLLRAMYAKRRANLLKATPKWLTEVDYERIKNCYKLADIQTRLTGSQWHVDHVIPLQGKEVCGLHVPNNLRAIPWLENVKKGNKLIEESV